MDDSFFDSPQFIASANGNQSEEIPTSTSTTNDDPSTTTPKQKRPRFQFGSHVRILKTHDVTPEPNFQHMDDKRIKDELARNGLKPMGRKRAIKILQDIYEHTHPIVDETMVKNHSVADKKHLTNRKKETDASKSTESESEDENGENVDDLFSVEGEIPSNIEDLHRAFMLWLREPEQEEIYLHCLQLKPVSFDELHLRILKTNSAICKMSKKALNEILDRAQISFSAPENKNGFRTKRQRRAK